MNSLTLVEFFETCQKKKWSPLSSGSWVSPLHKYFYIHVGKVASVKIRYCLHILEGYPEPEIGQLTRRSMPNQSFVPKLTDFDTARAVDILTSPEWFRFCFVRNPYHRIFSAYKSKIMSGDSQYQFVRDEILSTRNYPVRDGWPAANVTFRDFVLYVQEREALL